MWEEAVQLTKVPPKNGNKKMKKDQEEGKSQDGQYSRVMQALISAGMAPDTAATRQALRAKHPQANGLPAAVPQLTLFLMEVGKAVKEFRRGSAPGPTGLRPEQCSVNTSLPPCSWQERQGPPVPAVVSLF